MEELKVVGLDLAKTVFQVHGINSQCSQPAHRKHSGCRSAQRHGGRRQLWPVQEFRQCAQICLLPGHYAARTQQWRTADVAGHHQAGQQISASTEVWISAASSGQGGDANDADLLAIDGDDGVLGDLALQRAGLGAIIGGCGEAGEIAVGGEVEVGGDVRGLRARPGFSAGGRALQQVCHGLGAVVELVIAEGGNLQAHRVQDERGHWIDSRRMLAVVCLVQAVPQTIEAGWAFFRRRN